MSNLIKYDTAGRTLVEAHSVDEVKDICDRAMAPNAYVRQANDKQMLHRGAHPLTDAYPMMSGAPFDALKASIAEHGLYQPVVLFNGLVLDGRNRLKVCAELGIRPILVEYTGDPSLDALTAYVRATNERRDLTGEQRAATLLVQDAWLQSERANARKRQSAGGGDKRSAAYRESVDQKIDPPKQDIQAKNANSTNQKIAQNSGTNRQYVAELVKLRAAEPELFERVHAGEMTITQVKRVLKERKREAERQAARELAAPANLDDRVTLHNASLTDALSKPKETADWIITDPPYGKEFLPLYDELANVAEHALKPNGVLLCMCGQYHLIDVIKALEERLMYHWTISYFTPGGQAAQIFPRKVNTFWKPILMYCKGQYQGDWFGDVCQSKVNDNDKTYHHWGQSESGMHSLMSRFVKPGDHVIDFFLGGGTTGVVAYDLGATFEGYDEDPKAITKTRERFRGVG